MTGWKKELRLAFGWSVFYSVRTLDRFLSPAALRLLFWPAAAVLAGVETVRQSKRVNVRWKARTSFHLGRLIGFVPDRMRHKPWRGRCRLVGFEKIDAALAAKRPVIFATMHFGPLHLLHDWLRAFGYRATILTAASTSDRNEIRRRKDFLSNQESGFAATPHVVSRDELKRAVRLLENSVLIIAVDFPSTKYVDVQNGEVRFRTSTGAIRLAASHGALLSPCLICEVAPWQFEIHCGRPVPDNLLSPNADLNGTAAHLWREFQPLLAAHPDQCSEELTACFPK